MEGLEFHEYRALRSIERSMDQEIRNQALAFPTGQAIGGPSP